jgi:hypothetical protein
MDDSLPQVGTISLNVEYFRNIQVNQGISETFTQWITLFDDVDDDEFDGDLGEDDEELPMIKTTFSVEILEEPKQPGSPPRTKAASPKNKFSPKRDNLPTIEPPTQPVVAAPPMIKQPSPRASVKQPTAIARPSGGISNLYSPIKNVKKKVDTGLKPRNAGPEELVAMLQNTPSPRAGRYAQRRTDKQARASDIFGDFFGFGPNPPGCLSKGTP